MIHVEKFVFNAMEENTYLLWNEKAHAIIIDPGCYFTAEQETLEKLWKEKEVMVKDGMKSTAQVMNACMYLDPAQGLEVLCV